MSSVDSVHDLATFKAETAWWNGVREECCSTSGRQERDRRGNRDIKILLHVVLQ